NHIRRIAWDEVFPWLIILRSFRIAISPPLLGLATAAVLLSPLGWKVAAILFLTPEQRAAQPAGSQLAATLPPPIQAWIPGGAGNVFLGTYLELAEPLARFFRLELALSETAYYALGFLWTVAIWSFPGGVITRRAVVQLATNEPLGVGPASA